MAKANNQRLLAEGMFVEQNMTCRAIAELIGVSENSLSKWRIQGGWDKKHEENFASPHKIRELLLKELQKVAKGDDTTIDADALSKIGKVLESVSNKISPQTAVLVIKSFDNWMSEQDAATAVAFLEWHKRYIQYIISLHD